eukprot:15222078-Alexandrium_andersonii.AAC.1
MGASSGRPSLRSADGPIIQEVGQAAPAASAPPAPSPAGRGLAQGPTAPSARADSSMGGRRVPECTCLRHPSMHCPMHGE